MRVFVRSKKKLKMSDSFKVVLRISDREYAICFSPKILDMKDRTFVKFYIGYWLYWSFIFSFIIRLKFQLYNFYSRVQYAQLKLIFIHQNLLLQNKSQISNWWGCDKDGVWRLQFIVSVTKFAIVEEARLLSPHFITLISKSCLLKWNLFNFLQ